MVLKKVIISLFFIAALFCVKNSEAQESPAIVNRSHNIQIVDGKEYFFHAVLQGQTLFSIARAYGVSEDEILRENPEIREYGLRFDQLIRIPVRQHADAQRADSQVVRETTWIEHQVRRRETLYGISRMYTISMEQLLEHNPDARTGLRVNMILRIPRQVEKIVQTKEYKVPQGQTLFSISREFNVSIDDLKALNPELKQGLKAGQVIKIPADADAMLQPPFVVEEIPSEHPERKPGEPVAVDPYCEQPEKKSHYNVAFMMPFYLDRVDTLQAGDPVSGERHPSFVFMEYYQGLLQAVDSMQNRGVDIRLNVYDLCDNTLKARTLLRKPELSEMDLIIGPFHDNTFEIVAEFARVRDIPVVSPLHWQDNKIAARFPNVFQATPSIQTQMNDMALYVARTYPDDNIILVHNNQPGVIELIKGYKETLNRELNYRNYYRDSINLARIDGYFFNGVYVGERLTNVYVLNDSLLNARRSPSQKSQLDQYMQQDNLPEIIYSQGGMQEIKNKLDRNRRNVLVTLMGGEALVPDYVRQLNQLRDTFSLKVFGVQQWRDYRAIDYRYLQNINVHLFSSDFIDYEKSNNVDFIRNFRAENHVEPETIGFRAVQTGMYFFNALSQFGSGFYKCVNMVNKNKHPESPFWFERISDSGGMENKFVYIFKYENYRLKNVKEQSMRQASVVD